MATTLASKTKRSASEPAKAIPTFLESPYRLRKTFHGARESPKNTCSTDWLVSLPLPMNWISEKFLGFQLFHRNPDSKPLVSQVADMLPYRCELSLQVDSASIYSHGLQRASRLSKPHVSDIVQVPSHLISGHSWRKQFSGIGLPTTTSEPKTKCHWST